MDIPAPMKATSKHVLGWSDVQSCVGRLALYIRRLRFRFSNFLVIMAGEVVPDRRPTFL